MFQFDGISSFFGGNDINNNAVNQQIAGGYIAEGQKGNLAVSQVEGPEEEDDQDDHDEAADREDLLDQHVAYYMKQHPEVHSKHNLSRIRAGVYHCNGREIAVEWHYAEEPGQQGYLVAVDGPLRQPFSDYMEGTETGVRYDDKRLGKSSLSQIPKGKRLSFGDTNKVYSRLEAMKVAKEQALVREKAAEFSHAGMFVPQEELMAKYTKTLSQKLGERRQRQPEAAPAPQPEAPRAAPAPPPSTGVLAAAAAAAVESRQPEAAKAPSPADTKRKQTHGAPKYCANHNDTTKRKKCKPQNLPCYRCQTVIQTNYVDFSICPTCSERDHSCKCCGSRAVSSCPAPLPLAARPEREPPASPMNPFGASPMSARGASARAPSPMNARRAESPMNARAVSPMNARTPRSPMPGQQPSARSAMSPMNLFGMPDLFNQALAQGAEAHGGAAGGLFNQASSAWQGLLPKPQGNSYATTNPMASASPQHNAYASNSNGMFASHASPQNMYSSQNAYASQNAYSPMATQSRQMPGMSPRRF